MKMSNQGLLAAVLIILILSIGAAIVDKTGSYIASNDDSCKIPNDSAKTTHKTIIIDGITYNLIEVN